MSAAAPPTSTRVGKGCLASQGSPNKEIYPTRVNSADFAAFRLQVEQTVWFLGSPFEGERVWNIDLANKNVNDFLLRMAEVYFEVDDCLEEWESKQAMKDGYKRENRTLQMLVDIKRLAAFTNTLPFMFELSLKKMHYLFLLYVFCHQHDRFYPFGGFVRDLHTSAEPADCDVWMSHHCDHTHFASKCENLGYTIKWMGSDGGMYDKPIKRRNDYCSYQETFKLVLAGFGDILIFDIVLAGTFEEIRLDFMCNALYIESGEMGSGRIMTMAEYAKTDRTITYPPLSIAVRTNIVVGGMPLPFVGHSDCERQKPVIYYYNMQYTRPQSHQKTQQEFPAGLLERLEGDLKPDCDLYKFREALRTATLRMPTEADKKQCLLDIRDKIARRVDWGHADNADHRIEKMTSKGYKLI